VTARTRRRIVAAYFAAAGLLAVAAPACAERHQPANPNGTAYTWPSGPGAGLGR